jgi:cell wall assembly regulator SMI1
MGAAEVSQLWEALIRALALIDPTVTDNLFPGANDAAIARLRAGLGVPLPQELEALYRANDGEGRLGLDHESAVALFWVPNPAQGTGRTEYFFMTIDGVDGVITEAAGLAERASGGRPPPWSERRGPVRPASTEWIPFAKDFAGNFLCVDRDPESGGIEGQVIEAAYDDGRLQVVAPSLAAFLADLRCACS